MPFINHFPDLRSWNSRIAFYVTCGRPLLALALYYGFGFQICSPICFTSHTFVALLKACTKLRDLQGGLHMHAEVVRMGFLECDYYAGSALIGMYGEWGFLVKAEDVFNSLHFRNVVTWNTLIAAYMNHGKGEKVLECFEQMGLCGFSPNAITFVCSLKACSTIGAIEKGCQLHGEIVKKGILEEDVVIGRAMVGMYAKLRLIAVAQQVFDKLLDKDVISWTALIEGYVEHGHTEQALECYVKMQLDGVSPNSVTFLCVLKACANSGLIQKGQEIHSEVVKTGCIEKHLPVGNTVVDMYAKCGLFAEAKRSLDMLRIQDVVPWTALLSGYVDFGQGGEALHCLRQMQQHGIFPNEITFVCSLKACGSLGAIQSGQEVQAEIERRGLVEGNLLISCSLMEMYFNCFDIVKAQEIFTKLPTRNTVIWNALISGYHNCGLDEQVLRSFCQMKDEGILPDNFTYLYVVKACSATGAIEMGCEIHADVERQDLCKTDLAISNALLDMYARNGWLMKAEHIFNSLKAPDIISWTAIICGYAEHGEPEKSFECFEQMQRKGATPDVVTSVSMLKVCGEIRAIERGHQVHSEIERKGFLGEDYIIGNALVDMYVKCGLLIEAQEVFDELPDRDCVLWTTLIMGYVENGHGVQALMCFKKMQNEGISPDAITIMCVLKACQSVKAINKGLELHAETDIKVLWKRDFLGNTLLNMYSKLDSLTKAQNLFKTLPVQDVVSWNILIAGYGEHDHGKDALTCFERMQNIGLAPDNVTYISILKICGIVNAIEKGYSVHAEITRKGLLESDAIIGNSVINMYVDCGFLNAARQVLEILPFEDVIPWNSMIKGFAQHGKVGNVFDAYFTICEKGIMPDHVTFTIVLNACSRNCLFEKGQSFFEAMNEDYGIPPMLEHHSCMIDALGRMGRLDEAMKMINKYNVYANTIVWRSLLCMCKNWGNIQLGRHAFEHILSLNKKDSAAFVMMSQIHGDYPTSFS